MSITSTGWTRAVLPLAFLLAALPPVACTGVKGSGIEATKTRSVPAFAGVRAGNTVEVSVTVGGPQTVTVVADDNLVPLVRTRVRDGMLVIDATSNYRPTVHRPRVAITMPALGTIEASGSAAVDATGVTGAELRVGTSGGAQRTALG